MKSGIKIDLLFTDVVIAALDVGGIDMLLVDSGLNGMSVTGLAEAARQRHSALIVVLATEQTDPIAGPTSTCLPSRSM